MIAADVRTGRATPGWRSAIISPSTTPTTSSARYDQMISRLSAVTPTKKASVSRRPSVLGVMKW